MSVEWTTERLKKFQKTMKARKKAGLIHPGGPGKKKSGPRDVHIYLRHAKRAIMRDVRSGGDIGDGALYTLLALNALEKGT